MSDVSIVGAVYGMTIIIIIIIILLLLLYHALRLLRGYAPKGPRFSISLFIITYIHYNIFTQIIFYGFEVCIFHFLFFIKGLPFIFIFDC